MRAPESIAVQINGTAGDWTASVLAIGSPSAVETVARDAAVMLKPEAGVVATYHGVGFSDCGTAGAQVRIVKERAKIRASQPDAIAGRIAASEAAASARAEELAAAEAKAAEIIAKAQAAKAKADGALEAAKASKPAATAKMAATAKKAAKKAAKRKK